jgi:hypothetical protein
MLSDGCKNNLGAYITAECNGDVNKVGRKKDSAASVRIRLARNYHDVQCHGTAVEGV